MARRFHVRPATNRIDERNAVIRLDARIESRSKTQRGTDRDFSEKRTARAVSDPIRTRASDGGRKEREVDRMNGEVDHGSTRFGGALAGVIAACAALLLGWGTGNLASVAAGVVAAVASAHVPTVGARFASAEPWGLVEQFGPATVITGSVTCVLLLLVLVQVAAVLVVRPWVALDSASGFAFGGAALFLGALVAAELGAPPVVFCAVGAALVVRDVGDHATEVGYKSAEPRTPDE
jgi:hypothetical protein